MKNFDKGNMELREMWQFFVVRDFKGDVVEHSMI